MRRDLGSDSWAHAIVSNFDLAMSFTRSAEGGFTVDNGGPTDFGITQATYDTYRQSIGAPEQDVRHIGLSEVTAIMWQDYWVPANCNDLPARLSICQFDTAFNSGTHEAITLLQRALGVTADGDYGPITHAAVLACDDISTSSAYLDARWAFMQAICAGESPEVRLNGYRNRIDHLRSYLNNING